MSYWLVLAAGGGVFVPPVEVVDDSGLQPVNTAPMTMPSSTITMNILFIVGLTLTKSAQRTSTIFRLGQSLQSAVNATQRRSAAKPQSKLSSNRLQVAG